MYPGISLQLRQTLRYQNFKKVKFAAIMGLPTMENQSKSINLISKFLSSAQEVSLPSPTPQVFHYIRFLDGSLTS